MVSVFTPSFNKAEYVVDAIEGVLTQTYQNYEYWILENSNDKKTRKIVRRFKPHPKIKYIEIDLTDKQRKEFYPTAKILNTFYPQANGEFIFYLSDDDLVYEDCFERCISRLQTTDIVYFSHDIFEVDVENNIKKIGENRATVPIGKDTGMPLSCVIDGGQVMHRTSCLEKIRQPYFAYDYEIAAACDGRFMEELGSYYTFYPIGQTLGAHRRTSKSTFVKERLWNW